MKYISNIKMVRFILLGLIMLGLSNCTDRWEDMNSDPTRLKLIPDEYIFTSAVRGAFNDASGNLDITYGGQYAHIYISAQWTRDIDKYKGLGNSDYAQSIFWGVYGSSVKNSVEVMHLTAEDGDFPNKWRNAQAQFMAIIGFTKLTDAFGDVPYSEAGMGKYGIIKPRYDTQEYIYTDMIDRLGKIIEILQEDGAAEHIYPKGIDPIYDGNLDNWIRFANSFRLNLAMRVRFVEPQYEDVIRECFTLPLIESNDQNPTLATSSDPNNTAMWNPWYYKWLDWKNDKANLNFSAKFIDILKQSNDPRLPFFSIKVPDPYNIGDSTYLGIPNGLTDELFAQINRRVRCAPSGEFFAADQPVYMLTAAQVLLYKAEALLFGIIDGDDPNTVYQNAITTAMEQWNIAPDLITTYIENEPEATLSGSDIEDDFRKISTQFWISTVPNAYNGWVNIRRTGYPVIPQRTEPWLEKGVTDGYLPTRIMYPYTGEKSNNGEEMQKAIDRLPGGEDKIDIKVWWDVRDAPAD
ncbi:MAG: SusD/RagB family nutrient-binding outer membrane lipoprotein [Chlorobi bacterium]|nr:SusD/RagB family nutrient-binding outer membrane lipoprotein [Chlorobiota bacterium]